MRADCKAQRSSVNFPRQVSAPPGLSGTAYLSYPGFEADITRRSPGPCPSVITNGRCGSSAEEPMVCRLTAGGDWIRTIGSARRYASVSGEADQRVATSAPGRPQGGNPTGSATSARPSTGRNDSRSDPGRHSWRMPREAGAPGRTEPSRSWRRVPAEGCRNRRGCRPTKRGRRHE